MRVLKPFGRLPEFDEVVVPLSEREDLTANKSQTSGTTTEVTKGDHEVQSALARNNSKTSSLDSFRLEVSQDLIASQRDPNNEYDRKSTVINKAIDEIGMVPYVCMLFCLTGFGWAANNLWLQGIVVVLLAISQEYGLTDTAVRWVTFTLLGGLCVGALLWGSISESLGRRWSFYSCPFIAGVAGVAMGFSTTLVAMLICVFLVGSGIGGSLPVDGAILLEALPMSRTQWLTGLSAFWPIGQLFASLIAWLLIKTYSCPVDLMACGLVEDGIPCCTKGFNMVWRYTIFALGAITLRLFCCRFFLYRLLESPKHYLSRGEQKNAIWVVRGMAYNRNKTSWLTEDVLDDVGGGTVVVQKESTNKLFIVRKISQWHQLRLKPLFASTKLGVNTSLLWLIWTMVGMGYTLFNAFLPQYLLRARPDAPPTPLDTVYRNYLITSVFGFIGSCVAFCLVNTRALGRKWAMTIGTVFTGIFVELFTMSSDPSYQLGMSCAATFCQNIMYGVLYAYSPETFPASSRTTGTGIASCLNRLAGLFAPIIGILGATTDAKVPLYVSGALLLAAAIAMAGLRIETRNMQLS